MPTVITPAELAARAAAVKAEKAAKKANKGKLAASPAPAPTAPSAPAPAVVPTTKGKLTDTLSPDALRAQIDALLSKLRAETNPDAKKKIRRALRLRGHRGGLSHERAAAAAETADETAQPAPEAAAPVAPSPVASECDTNGAEGG